MVEGTNAKAINIVRLWALTGCRRNEITGLKWNEIDFDNGLLVLADSKTGRPVRPIGTSVLTLLKGIEGDEESEFVFPADSGERHFQGTKTPWARAVKKTELPGVTPTFSMSPQEKPPIAFTLSTRSAPASPQSRSADADAELLRVLADRLAKGGTAARNMLVALRLLLGGEEIAEAA